MTDEKYTFIQDVRDKKITARSARSTRTHNGKRGAVKLPCDYMTKKEISAMSGEVKSYRLNEPMIWKEFMAMPDDIKTTYIKLLRQKYNVPALRISAMLSISPKYLTNELQRLGLADGHTRSGRTKWDKEGWTAFLNGVPRQVAAEPDVTIPEETSDAVAEAVTEAFAEIQEGSHTSETSAAPVTIPRCGSLSFVGAAADALTTVASLLGGANVQIHIAWELSDNG